MFERTKTPTGCPQYEARLEDHLTGSEDPGLVRHLEDCAKCRAALENARVAGAWIRQVLEPTAEPRSAFLSGVMARIAEKQLRAQSPAAFWSPLELLASRLSLTAAALLLALSVYLMEFAPRMATVSPPPPSELSAADFPQPPADPVGSDEVLQSLAEREYGR